MITILEKIHNTHVWKFYNFQPCMLAQPIENGNATKWWTTKMLQRTSDGSWSTQIQEKKQKFWWVEDEDHSYQKWNPISIFFSSSESGPSFKLIYSPPPRFESGDPAWQADVIQMYQLTQLTQIMRWRSWQCGRFPCLCWWLEAWVRTKGRLDYWSEPTCDQAVR